MTATLFPAAEVVCGKVKARAHDGEYRFELRCHRRRDHDGPCRVLDWIEVAP